MLEEIIIYGSTAQMVDGHQTVNLAHFRNTIGSSPFTPTSIEIFVLDLWKVMWVETQISHYGYWAGMVTLRRTENP
jgi:hypothetical protein